MFLACPSQLQLLEMRIQPERDIFLATTNAR
jgi:hypothetical protein